MDGGVCAGCLLGGVACIHAAVLPSDQALCEARREVGGFRPLKLATSFENRQRDRGLPGNEETVKTR